jgi:glutathione synthase/RimK-type ligase-like ATP-grasp enzyme
MDKRAKKRNVKVITIDLRKNNSLDKIRKCDGLMCHLIHSPDDKQLASKVLNVIEFDLKIPVYPNFFSRWHYDEKVAQFYLLKALNAPRAKTWVFWTKQEAIKYAKNAIYPIIFKLSAGAGSANVIKVNNYCQAHELINKNFDHGFFPYTINEFKKNYMQLLPLILNLKHLKSSINYLLLNQYPPLPYYFQAQKNYIYFQEFIPNNQYDIRITVIGNRAFGFIRYNRKGDFRASGSGKLDTNPKNIPLEAIKTCHDLAVKGRFQTMAFDLLKNNQGKYVVSEISYCYVNGAVASCPGFWDRKLKWHNTSMWPEQAHVEDFIHFVKTKKLP